MGLVHTPLIESKVVILPPLHIQLGLMKKFVKLLYRSSNAFLYLKETFPKISDAKIKKEIFVGPQIRELTNYENFDQQLNQLEKLT